jgi:hypothetical protein
MGLAIMSRREFISPCGGAAAWPLAARAQSPAIPVVGFLGSRSEETTQPSVSAFREGLREGGYFESAGESASIPTISPATKLWLNAATRIHKCPGRLWHGR